MKKLNEGEYFTQEPIEPLYTYKKFTCKLCDYYFIIQTIVKEILGETPEDKIKRKQTAHLESCHIKKTINA